MAFCEGEPGILEPEARRFWRALVTLTSGVVLADGRAMLPPRTAVDKGAEAGNWALDQFLDAPLPDRRLKKARSGSDGHHRESATFLAQGL